jgi:hypothetical protein
VGHAVVDNHVKVKTEMLQLRLMEKKRELWAGRMSMR